MVPSRPLRGPARPPAERVRERLRIEGSGEWTEELPGGYQRLGQVLVLRLPERLRARFAEIGRAWQAELGVATVLTHVGAVSGELREPRLERIAGTETETEVVEHGVRWRFDAARIMFAAGNRTERRRAGALVAPGESVVDLFAGIGYFAIPAARSGPGTRVVAVEKNPLAHRYLLENAHRNGVEERIDARLGENRTVPLEPGRADRVFLGFLPDAVPWVPVALPLLRTSGGWLHVHTVADARDARARAGAAVARAIASAGGTLREPVRPREVKPYGPGRTHVVVDASACPPAP